MAEVTIGKLPVFVKDPAGKPIAGAELMAYAMRMKEVPGHGYWDERLLGRFRTVISDENGMTEIGYPIQMRRRSEVLTSRLLTFLVKHPEFVPQVVDFDLGPERAEVILEPGCEIRISVIDEVGQPVEDFGIVMGDPNRIEAGLWELLESGERRTRSVEAGARQILLVCLQEQGPTLFSDVLELQCRLEETATAPKVSLRPGAVIRGRLSDNVPRPVKAGTVQATCVPMPRENDDNREPVVWHDWTMITEDGTFEFESLPRGGKLQLIVVFDGGVSTTTVPESRGFVMGQTFDVFDGCLEVVIDTEETGTLEVEVVTQEGVPVTEGFVSASPNQALFQSGSTFLGRRFRSADGIESQFFPPTPERFRDGMCNISHSSKISARMVSRF